MVISGMRKFLGDNSGVSNLEQIKYKFIKMLLMQKLLCSIWDKM